MRYLLLGFAAIAALGMANAPAARAFETQIDDSTNADGSPRFADPEEPLEALAEGAGSGSGYVFKLPDVGVASGNSQGVESGRSVAWTPERIRLVFGPYAH
jgi:hypothetical protein